MKIILFKSHFNYLILIVILSLLTINSNATNYYSDPIFGSMSNSGTAISPWANLQSIFSANKTFLAGDTIFLRNGNHGAPVVKGTNSNFVVITPQLGHNPIVSRVRFTSTGSQTADYWKLYKVMVQSQSTSTIAGQPSYALIEIGSPATRITISSCTVTSNPNTTGWTRDDWRYNCSNGIFTRAKLNSNIIIEKNLFSNICFGLQISSSNCAVISNTVTNFTSDAVRILGSNIVFKKNVLKDYIKVFTNLENHSDLLQGFTANGPGQDTLKNVIISENIGIVCTDSTRAFRGACQGMSCFDGPVANWKMENNIVICDAFNGMVLSSAQNCTITNNTVIDPYKYTPIDTFETSIGQNNGPAWIGIGQKPADPQSFGNIITNNICRLISLNSPTVVVTNSNNYLIPSSSTYSLVFVNAPYSDYTSSFDLHLKSGSTAIDYGVNNTSPLVDYDGISRPQGPNADAGAYEYVIPANTVVVNSGIMCKGSSITLAASPALSYTWSTGAHTSSIVVSPTVTTTYTLLATTIIGLVSTTAKVTVPTVIANAFSTSLCMGDSGIVKGYTSFPNSYSWETGATTANILVSPTVTTVYSYTATDVNGCQASNTSTAVVKPVPLLSVNSVTICGGGSANLSVTGATTYTWSTGATSTSISVTPSSSTIYTVVGTNSVACSTTDTATVAVITVASPTITQVGQVLTSSSLSGNQWYLNGVPISGATSQTYIATVNGSYSLNQTIGMCSASSNTINITTNSVDDLSLKYAISITPNPAQDYIFINTSYHLQEPLNYKIFSMDGRLMKDHQLIGTDKKMIHVQDLSSGIYVIEFSAGNRKATFKFVKG